MKERETSRPQSNVYRKRERQRKRRKTQANEHFREYKTRHTHTHSRRSDGARGKQGKLKGGEQERLREQKRQTKRQASKTSRIKTGMGDGVSGERHGSAKWKR